MKIIKKFLEIIFPSHCLFCSSIISSESLFCENCWPQLKFITDPKCIVCAQPFDFQVYVSTCVKCLNKKPAFDETITIFRYNQMMRKVISNLKYNDQTFIAQKFSQILFGKIKNKISDFDMIVAVPLHKKRLQQRKFNQAVLLAKNLQKLTDLEFISDLIIRDKYTKSQVTLKRKEREKNLKYAFHINPKYRDYVREKRILLVDDVITTGATLENCARILKRNNCAKITVLTIAKTILNE